MTRQGRYYSARAQSANSAMKNPKLRGYETLIMKLKKILESEKKNLRSVKSMLSGHIETRNFLEKLLRQCVDDVKNEIAKKRSEAKVQ